MAAKQDWNREIESFLEQRRVAVAGVSRSPKQPANAIFRKLREAGVEAFAVNPAAERVEGVRCYPNLRAIRGGVEAVVIATPPDTTLEIVRDCVALGIRHVWIHRSFGQGSFSEEAAALARAHDIEVIPGGCPMMFYEPVDVGHRCMLWFLRLTGSLPKAA